MLLKDALERFLREDRSPATNTGYRVTLGKMVAALGPCRDLTHVTREDVADYLNLLRAQRVKYKDHPRRPAEFAPLRPATIARVVKDIKNFFNWCKDQGYIQDSPAARVSARRYEPLPGSSKAVSAEELNAMIERARTKRVNRERDYAILLFMADTGCRVGGCASLTLDNLHLEDRSAVLVEKGSKLHRVFFCQETAQAIRHWLAVRPRVTTRHVWLRTNDDPLDRKGIAVMVRRVAQKAIGRGIGPHAIRHRVGQAWADAGANPELVRLKLGHSGVGITLKHYFNQDFTRVRNTSDDLGLAALGPRQGKPDDKDEPAASESPKKNGEDRTDDDSEVSDLAAR